MSYDERDLDLYLSPLPTHSYTYLAIDLRNDNIIAELPLQNVSYERKLSTAGDFSASLQVNDETLTLDLRQVTAPGKTGVYILRDGQPVWGGIVWKRTYDSTSRSLKINGKTFESYFYHRLQLTTKAWDDADQLDIARWLVQSNGSAAALGIAVSDVKSGELRDRVMFGYEFKTTGQELEQLSKLIGGFDWNVRFFQNSDYSIGKKLEFYYPYAGVARESSLLFFEYPGGIKDFNVSEDAENGGNSIWAIGAGEGTEQVKANSVDPGDIAAKWPLLELSRSYKDVVRPSTLQGHSDSDRDRLRIPITVFEVTVRPDSEPALGSYDLGDWVRFRMEDPFLTPALDTYARITGIKVSIDNSSGIEKVDLTLGGDEVQTDSV